MVKGKSGFRKSPSKKVDSAEASAFISGAQEGPKDIAAFSKSSVSTAEEQLDLARKALSLVLILEECKGLTEHVDAIRFYASQAEALIGLEKRSSEIRLRAERRAGQLLTDWPKQPPDLDGKETGHALPSLEELGITEPQFRRWRALAAIREEEFEQETARARGVEKEFAGLLEAESVKNSSLPSEAAVGPRPSRNSEPQPDIECMDDKFRAAVEAMVTAIKNADEDGWQTTSKKTALQYIEMLRHMIIIDGLQ